MPTATSRPRKPSSDVVADLEDAPADGGLSVGFLGLGIMGTAMSNNLLKAGFEVSGFDPSEAARKRLGKSGGHPCASAAEVALSADVIITSLPSTRALIEATEAIAGAASRSRKGLVVVETSTLDIDDKIAARDALQAVGIVLLDCPLSGTGAQAMTKDVSVYSSGSETAVQHLQPVFDGFSKANYYLGAFGNGMRMKLMANLLVAIHNVSTAEVLLFGKRMGIAPELAVKVLSDGAGGSRMFQVRGPVMASRTWDEATMKVGVWQKDMKLIHAALAATHTPAPLFAATEPIYNAAMAAGHAEHDTAAVFDVLARMCEAVTTSS
jgi:3-hydroxyisobutyrate dehydrogenase-like beta-hydroxyacid dehydrogenase